MKQKSRFVLTSAILLQETLTMVFTILLFLKESVVSEFIPLLVVDTSSLASSTIAEIKFILAMDGSSLLERSTSAPLTAVKETNTTLQAVKAEDSPNHRRAHSMNEYVASKKSKKHLGDTPGKDWLAVASVESLPLCEDEPFGSNSESEMEKKQNWWEVATSWFRLDTREKPRSTSQPPLVSGLRIDLEGHRKLSPPLHPIYWIRTPAGRTPILFFPAPPAQGAEQLEECGGPSKQYRHPRRYSDP